MDGKNKIVITGYGQDDTSKKLINDVRTGSSDRGCNIPPRGIIQNI